MATAALESVSLPSNTGHHKNCKNTHSFWLTQTHTARFLKRKGGAHKTGLKHPLQKPKTQASRTRAQCNMNNSGFGPYAHITESSFNLARARQGDAFRLCNCPI